MHGDAHSPFLAVGPVGPALKICARWNSQIHRLAGVGLDHNVISCHIMSYPILWTLQRLQLCQLCHVRFQRNICSQVAESKRTIKSGNKSTSNLWKSVLDLHVTCKMCSMCSVQRLKPIAIEALR